MKKRAFIIIAVIITAAICMTLIATKIIERNLNQLSEMKISDVDLSSIADGTYHGSYEVFPVAAEVAVTVENHKITGIELIRHRNGRGAAAESIPDSVVKADSLKVDAVTGATYSSKVILKAIENALINADQKLTG